MKTPSPLRTRSALVAGMLCATLLPSVAMAGVNDPQVRLLFPRDGGSLRSDRVPLVMARFDRTLRPPTELTVTDRNGAAVNGISRLNEPDGEPESWRAVEFLPTNPLPEAGSPFRADAWVCGVELRCRMVSWTFRIDDTAPAVPSVSSPANNAFVTDQVVTVRGVAEPGADVFVYEVPDLQVAIGRDVADTSGRYVVELPYPPEDGASHTIRVGARDEAGNRSALSSARTFRHDAITVGPIITEPLPGDVLATSTVTVSGRAKANTAVHIRSGFTPIATTSAGADGRFSTTITRAHGVHTITAESFDGFVTDGPSPAVTFEVDLIAPAAPVIVLPTAGSAASGPDVLIVGTGEAGSTIRLRDPSVIRGTAPIDGSGDWALVLSFPDGPRTVTAEVIDRAGNVGPDASVSFVVDSVAPVAPIINLPPDGTSVNTSAVIVSGSAEASSTVAIEMHASVIGTGVASGSGAFAIPIPFADGTYTIRARAIDAAGNRGPLGSAVTFEVDTVVPAVPVIQQPYDTETLNNSPIVVSGTAEPNSGVRVFEGSSTLALVTTRTDGSWSTQISVTAGAHALRATATDRAGNTSAPTAIVNITFDPGAPDVTPPAAPLIVSPAHLSYASAFVIFRGVSEPNATVEIFEGLSILVSATADWSGVWETGLLLTSGPHTIHGRARDRAGNLGPNSASRTFTVDGVRPTVQITSIDPAIVLPLEPIIVNGTASDNFSVAAIEVEATDRLTSARFGPFTGSCPACPGAPVSWDATIALPPGLYRIEVFAVDHVGNRSPGGSATVLRL